MLRWLQNYPHFLEVAYDFTHRLLRPFGRWLKPGGGLERVFVGGEILSKGAVFNCQMCGQCVLHSTGMTCPMNCPKNLRNGPCGGVRPDGRCEVLPEMACVWVQAYERSRRMPEYGPHLRDILAPLNRSLQGTSAWINDIALPEKLRPVGWTEPGPA